MYGGKTRQSSEMGRRETYWDMMCSLLLRKQLRRKTETVTAGWFWLWRVWRMQVSATLLKHWLLGNKAWVLAL